MIGCHRAPPPTSAPAARQATPPRGVEPGSPLPCSTPAPLEQVRRCLEQEAGRAELLDDYHAPRTQILRTRACDGHSCTRRFFLLGQQTAGWQVLAYLGRDEVGARRSDHSMVYFDLYPYEERLLLSVETAESPEGGGGRRRDLCLCVIPGDLRQPVTCPVQAPLQTARGVALEAKLERDGRVELRLLPSSQPPGAATRQLLGGYQLW